MSEGEQNHNGKRAATQSPTQDKPPPSKASATRSSISGTSSTRDDSDDDDSSHDKKPAQAKVKRARTEGVKPQDLSSVTDMYKSGELELLNQDEEEDNAGSKQYHADSALNRKVILW
jgi:hypothetical protein